MGTWVKVLVGPRISPPYSSSDHVIFALQFALMLLLIFVLQIVAATLGFLFSSMVNTSLFQPFPCQTGPKVKWMFLRSFRLV